MSGSGVESFSSVSERFSDARPLGSGGMGVVHAVYDRKRGEHVALKSMPRVNPSSIYRFKQEFRALADVAHPNLVVLHELISEAEQWFFTMELLDGVDFLGYVRSARVVVLGDGHLGESESASAVAVTGFGPGTPPRTSSLLATMDLGQLAAGTAPTIVPPQTSGGDAGPDGAVGMAAGGQGAMTSATSSAVVVQNHFDGARLQRAMQQLAEGLTALHAAGKLHRDVKPSNVMVTREGRLVLLDFGLVADLAAERDGGVREIAGTPEYMSPEQMAGQPQVAASDWYSVGVMIYEAVTGRLPFKNGRDQWQALLEEKRAAAMAPPSSIAPQVDPVLDALCMDLLRGEPAARPTGAEVRGRLLGRQPGVATGPVLGAAETRLVGRQAHLAALADAFTDAASGRTVTVYVHGVTGMGKSVLLRSFLDGFLADGRAVVLEGRCYERESVPYKGLDSLVDALSRHLASLPTVDVAAILPRHIGALTRIFPVLDQVRAVATAPGRGADVPDQQELRRRAFGALRELLARMADRRPLVLAIDDLQWGDLDSAALLGEVLRPPDAPALLFVGSFRSEARTNAPSVRALPQRGHAGHDVRELEVGALDAAQARELADALLGPELGGKHAAAIAGESKGSPFFIGELARHVTESDTPLNKVVTLDDVLLERLQRLPDEPRRLLEVVAVAGRPTGEPVVRRAAGLGVEESAALAMLRAAHLVRMRSTDEGEVIEAFHDRICELIVSRAPADRVRECHARLADELEASGHGDPEALADHHKGAGHFAKAAPYALLAAEQADRALAFDRAAKLYQLALDLHSDGAAAPAAIADAGKRALRGRLADALANAGRSAEAAAVYLGAAAETDPSDGQKLEWERRAAEQFLISGHIDDGLRVIHQVLAAVGLRMASSPRSAVLSLVLRRLRLKLRGLGFKQRAAADVPASDLLRVDVCWAVARGLGMVDNIRATDFQTQHLLFALAAGEPYRIARGLAMDVAFMSGPGGPNKKITQALTASARELAARVEQPHAVALAELTAGMSCYLRGEFSDAVGLCAKAEEMLRERCTGVAWELASAHRFWMGSLMYLGELRELRERVGMLLQAARDRGNLYAATDIRTRYNIAWLAADEPDEARRHHDEAMAQWSNKGFHLQHYSSLLAMTQLALYRGDGAGAHRIIDDTWPALERSMLMRIQLLRVEAWHLRARSRLADAPSAATLAAVEGDAKRIAGEHMAWCAPIALLVRAAVAAQRGDKAQAVRLLEAALEGFSAHSLALYAAVTRWRLAELDADRFADQRGVAEAWFARQGVVAPSSMVRMLAPGFTVAGQPTQPLSHVAT